MTANDGLLPCPFCGGKAAVGYATGSGWNKVFCLKCDTAVYKRGARFVEDFWNTRIAPYTHSQVMALVEAAEYALKHGLHCGDYSSDKLIKSANTGEGLLREALQPFTQQKEQPNE